MFFDSQLRGKDGSDIWRISPSGLRVELIESKPAQKGSSVRLSIDSQLQGLAERSLRQMSQRVATHRILPDPDWLKTIEKRTRRELIRAKENELSPELLLNSFKDAPYPLSGRQASPPWPVSRELPRMRTACSAYSTRKECWQRQTLNRTNTFWPHLRLLRERPSCLT